MPYQLNYSKLRVDIDPKHPALYYFAHDEDKDVIGLMKLYTIEKNSLWIGTLFVHEKHRRRGIGRMLIALAEHEAILTNRRFLSLAVAKDNEPAKKLYQELGFEDFSEAQEDYRQYIKLLPSIASGQPTTAGDLGQHQPATQ